MTFKIQPLSGGEIQHILDKLLFRYIFIMVFFFMLKVDKM